MQPGAMPQVFRENIVRSWRERRVFHAGKKCLLHTKNTTLAELHLKICCASELRSSSIRFVRVFPSLGIVWYSDPSKCSINNGLVCPV